MDAHFAAAAASLACIAAAGLDPAIDPDLARQYFEEAAALSLRDGGELWGVPLAGPILFVEPASRAAVANAADEAGALRGGRGVYAGTLPAEVGLANTAVVWAGRRWTMVLWPLPQDEADRGRLLMHECFHRIQPGLGLMTADAPNAHLDERDGRLWMRLEWEALASALEGGGREAALDAILFRECRYAIFPEAREQERRLELNEGLAEYTGLRAGVAGRDEQRRRAVEALRSAHERESLVRSFAYVTGPAWGMLLDSADPGWRAGASQARGLDDLLRAAMRYAVPAELQPRATSRAADYGYAQVLAAEEVRQQRRNAERAAATELYVSGPVLIVPLSSPSLTFDPGRMTALPGYGTVYGTLEVRDEWGTAAAEAGALLSDAFALRLPQPGGAPGATLQGPGWRVTLQAGWVALPGPRPGDLTVGRAGS